MLMTIKFDNVVIKTGKSINHLMVKLIQCDKCDQHTEKEAEAEAKPDRRGVQRKHDLL